MMIAATPNGRKEEDPEADTVRLYLSNVEQHTLSINHHHNT